MSRHDAASLVGLAEGAGVSVTSGGGVGSEWAPGAWVEWDDALADDIYLAGCACHFGDGASASLLGIEVAIGASGSETALVAQAYGSTFGTPNSGGEVFYAFDLPVFIAAGSRVAVRLRFWRNSAQTFDPVRLVWYPSALASDFRSRATGIMLPDNTAAIHVTWSAPAWTWTAWTELAATGLEADGAIGSVGLKGYGQPCEFEVGSGAAGAEVAFLRVRGVASDYNAHTVMPPAPVPIPAGGDRLAVRTRSPHTTQHLYYAVNAYGPEPETEVWVPVANYVEQEIAGESFPGGAARVLGELWTEALGSPGPVVKARLYNLTDSVSVGESAEIQSDEPAACDFAVTLSSGTKRYRLEVTSEPAVVDLFFSGRGVGP